MKILTQNQVDDMMERFAEILDQHRTQNFETKQSEFFVTDDLLKDLTQAVDVVLTEIK